jgi:hypothetical protein
MPLMHLCIPIRTVSEANCSQHWTKKHKRHKKQKGIVEYLLNTQKQDIDLPVEVILTRVAPRFLDSDNLQSSLKYIRDSVASYLIPGGTDGQADSDDRIQWRYKQEKGQPKEYLVQITINKMDGL